MNADFYPPMPLVNVERKLDVIKLAQRQITVNPRRIREITNYSRRSYLCPQIFK